MVDTVCIIQARFNSRRLIGKIALDLHGKPLLIRVVEQVQKVNRNIDIIIATTSEKIDDLTESIAKKFKIKVYRGSVEDVRSRYLECGNKYKYILRVTADNPFVEPSFIEEVYDSLHNEELNFIDMKECPHGSDVQGMTYAFLLYTSKLYYDSYDKEHVINVENLSDKIQVKRKTIIPSNHIKRPDVRVTVDTIDDYRRAFLIYRELINNNLEVKLSNIIKIYDKIFDTNLNHNE